PRRRLDEAGGGEEELQLGAEGHVHPAGDPDRQLEGTGGARCGAGDGDIGRGYRWERAGRPRGERTGGVDVAEPARVQVHAQDVEVDLVAAAGAVVDAQRP